MEILFLIIALLELLGIIIIYKEAMEGDSIDPRKAPENFIGVILLGLIFGIPYALWKIFEFIWNHTIKRGE